MNEKIKGILYLGIIILFVVLVYYFLDKNNINIYDNNLIKYLNNNFDYVNITSKEININIDKRIDLMNLIGFENSSIKFIPNTDLVLVPTINNKSNENKDYVKDSKKEELKDAKPIVYIYNTHNKEQYSYNKNEAYNIIPTVMNTSYMLQESLKKHNINSIVEENDVSKVLKKNGWNYASSYRVTRLFLQNALKNNSSLKYFIDVHRDSVKKNITTIEIDGIKYARVLFILGLENKNYHKNTKMIEYINNEINKQYPKLSRGIYKKEGKGVNGIYNQDFSENCILIEFGGVENTIDEVNNTVSIVGSIISKYIGDDNETN